MCLRIINLFFFILILDGVNAQEYIQNTVHYNLEKGLQTRNIRCAFKDSQGRMWFGSDIGAYRFDGFEFHLYQTTNASSIPYSTERINEDEDQNLWFFHHDATFNKETVSILPKNGDVLLPIDKFFGDKFPFPVEHLSEMSHYSYQKNGIWIVNNQTREIYEHQNGGFRKIGSIPIGAKSTDLYRRFYVAKDSRGDVWLSYDFALFKLAKGTSKFVKIDKTDAITYRIKIDKSDKIWLESLWVLEQKESPDSPLIKPSIIEGLSIPPASFFRGADFTDEYIIFFDALDHQVKLIDKITGEQIVLKSSMELMGKNLVPTSVCIDGNSVWICTYEGIYQTTFRKNPFQNYLKSRSTRGICQIPNDSNLIVATYSGYYKINLKTGSEELVQPLKGGLACGQNTIINPDNNLWYGGRLYAFYEVTATQPFEYKMHWNREGTGEITNFYKHETSKKYFAGSDVGILKYHEDKNVFDTINCNNKFAKLKQSTVFDFEYLDDENFLAATSTGIYQVNINTGVTDYFNTENNSTPNNYITYIHKDKDKVQDQIFWVGTKLGGLFQWKYPNTTLKHFTTESGLADNTIYSIHDDPVNEGYMWMPSNNGLMHFNKSTNEVTTYKVKDGIMHDEFNFNSYFTAADSTIYLGGIQGITSFNPKDIVVTEERPVLHLSGYKTYDKKYKTRTSKLISYYKNEKVNLPSNKSEIEIALGLTIYESLNQCEFYYNIDKESDQWIKMKDNTTTITGLSSGDHTIYLKGKNASGLWTSNEIEIPVTRLLPFYFRWWFLLLLAAVLYGLVRLFVWDRTNRLNKRNEELEVEVAARTKRIEEDKAVIEKQATELQQLDEVKSRFFSNVTHELRTPITLIIGPLRHLIKSGDITSAKAIKTLESIAQNGNQLKDLVEEILDLSRLDADKIHLIKEPVRLRNIIERLISNFEPEAENRNIKFNLVYNAATNLYLDLDAQKLERIVVNLLSNAFKFSNEGDSITLKLVELEDKIQLSVSDTGIGIHEEDLSHIFERFYQTRKTDSSLQGGLGIGLALSNEMARLMGGKLSVTSEIGKGSNFSFVFPKEITEAKMTTNPVETFNDAEVVNNAPAKIKKRNKNILIVEDNKQMRNFIHELLEPLANIQLAHNGKVALNMLRKRKAEVDIIVSDVMMPEIDGFTLLNKLRQDKKWQLTPIVFLTARADIQDKIKALVIGVDDYIVKPFEPDELIARIRNLLEKIESREEIEKPVETPPEVSVPVSESATQKDYKIINEFEETDSADLKWLKEIEQVAIENIEQSTFNVVQFAFKVHIGERQLARKLKKVIGMTPGSYLKEVRLQKARHLLENKTYSTVAEVAFKVGFTTPEYFSKIFKRRFGKLPTEYTKIKDNSPK